VNIRIWPLATLAALALAACSSLPTKLQSTYPSPDGSWGGAIPITGPSPEQLELRLSIDGERAQVWVVHEGSWVEVKPGTFQVRRQLSNAIISSIDSGEDGDGTWVESWVLVTTPVASDKLLVAWTRVVNNIDVEEESSKFVVQATGTIQAEPASIGR
jgi:hypothetical protein